MSNGILRRFKELVGAEEPEMDMNDTTEFIDIKNGETEDGETRIRSKGKIMNMTATTKLKVILLKPESLGEVTAVADHLKKQYTVLLNLENTNKELTRRVIDFVGGAAYINNGSLKQIAKSTFIVTPYNVDFTGDVLDELENNGVFF
ncbi:MAG: cell division protein SepF [Oscillospiraceae bacterium]|nr:cell division protein SepF [Oscillospiraceae bacterium]